MKKFVLLLFCMSLITMQVVNAQVRRVSGTVTNAADGSSIPGVSVVVKGTTIGIITSADGKYQLDVPEGAQALVFSFVGMKKVEVPISGSTVDVKMEPDVIGVDEVMVVAYGTATKESFTGSATKVSGEKLAEKNTTEVTKALMGEVPGVQVIEGSGQPGTTATIRIRGLGSVNASRSPLYVVDGVPFNGDLSSIDPSDIESMTILKDASATALYGNRGANGVIVITTKRGVKNQQNIDVDVSYGANLRLLPLYDAISSPEQYIELTWEGLKNKYTSQGVANPAQQASHDLFVSGVGIHPAYNLWNVDGASVIDPSTGKMNPNATRRYTPGSWEDAIFSTGQRTDASVRMSGGSDKGSYYTSIGYLNEDGYYIGSDYERISARTNVDQKLRDWLSTTLNLNYAYSERNSPGQTDIANNGFYFINNIPPIYPVYVRDANGDKVIDPKTNGYLFDYGFNDVTGERGFGANINPAGAVALDKDFYITHNFTGNATVEARFLQNFKFNSNFGVQYVGQNRSRLTNLLHGDAEGIGRIYKSQENLLSYTFNQILSYQKALGEHNFEAFIAHENTLYRDGFMEGSKSKIARPENIEWDNAVLMDYMNSEVIDYALESYFGQLKYNYQSKYYLYATLRYDGTSRFPGNKWGTFGSVGAAWMMSKESFLAGVNWLSMLKLKASYGTLGNQAIGNYPTFDQYTLSNLNDELSISFDYKGNPDLTWESSSTSNAGLEFGIGKLLSGDVEVYNKKTTNMLFYKQVAPSLGFSEIPVNDGVLVNRGVEFDLTGHVINTKDIKMDIRVNGAHYHNEMTTMPIDNTTGKPKILEVQGAYAYAKGHSIYDYYVREYAGVDPQSGLAQWNRYYDMVNGTKNYITDMQTYLSENTITDLGVETTTNYDQATKKFVGKSAIPDLSGGFGLDFSYKGLALTTQFAYSLGGYAYDNIYAVLMGDPLPGGNNWSKDILKRWQNPGDVTDVPRLSSNYDKNANNVSTRFLTKSSYLYLNSVMLSYSLPENLVKRIGLGKASIWVSGDNLFLLTTRKGFIPIGSESGATNRARYAPLSTLATGIKLQF